MKKSPHLIFTIFFVIAVILLHHNSWNKPPTSIHAWAQSDHYAIALGFLENSFDFFHPKTFSLSQQFPPHHALDNPSGITAIDFPIFHYIVASVMFLTGNSSPLVFRLVALIYSFIALSFLFNTIQRFHGIKMALLTVAFILFQPIYSYYQDGFHVASAAFNTLIIGYCFLIKYYQNNQPNLFRYGILFVTLAALMRFTHLISLLAFGGMLLVYMVKDKRLDKRIVPVIGGIAIVLTYFIYNQTLAANYGSVFLNKPLISQSLNDLYIELSNMARMYIRSFVPPFHTILLFLFTMYYLRRIRMKQFFSPKFIWFSLLVLGAGCFNLLMSWHLSVHDYYALDVWMPAVSLGLLFAIVLIDRNKLILLNKRAIILSLIAGMFIYAIHTQEKAYGQYLEESKAADVIEDFTNSSQFLDNTMPVGAKILVICGEGWNTPMVGWNRNVYRVAWKFKARIPEELSKEYDFIVTHNSSFENNVMKNYPEFANHVSQYKTNEKVTIWEQNKVRPKPTNIFSDKRIAKVEANVSPLNLE